MGTTGTPIDLRAVLDGLRSGGYEFDTPVLGKGGLMRILTGSSDLQSRSFRDFTDEP